MNRRLRMLTTSILCLGLFACGSNPKRPEISNSNNGPEKSSLQRALIKSEQSDTISSNRYQLVAAEISLKDEQWPILRSIIKKIDPTYLNEDEILRLAIIRSELIAHEGDQLGSLMALDDKFILQASRQASANQQSIYLEILAKKLAAAGNLERALNILIERDALLNGNLAKINRENIWNLLLLINDESISNMTSGENLIIAGWAKLAKLYRDTGKDITDQANALDNWRNQWRSHPANQDLPGGLQLLDDAAKELPQKILIAVPLTGDLSFVGQTLRDGILYERWQQMNQGNQTPAMYFIDSNKFTAEQLIETTKTSQADLLIGPFDKDKAQVIADNANQLPNTLLLNVINKKSPAKNIVSFGLNPEDEATQIARRAFIESGKRALIISPNTALGDRLQRAFVDEWLVLNGNINQIGRYEDNKDISNTIKQALNIDKSEMRKRRLALNTGLSLEFEPRRREDIDVAAFFAKPNDARSIAPLFDFHYAQDLPLYTTSLAFSGIINATADKDLEGVVFNDIPWLFDPASQQLNDISYQRLFAMGIDTYRLQRRYKLLSADNIVIQGTTGKLSLNSNREIVRQLDWATFKDGLPSKIKPISTDLIHNEQATR
jgi:outer membrane PBP1 activator LpoA protein